MKFFSVAAMAVLAAVAEARLAFTNSDFTITAGEPFTLTWDGASAPVTITLMNGPNGDLKDVMVLDCRLPQILNANSALVLLWRLTFFPRDSR
jgi:hypothetical protein